MNSRISTELSTLTHSLSLKIFSHRHITSFIIFFCSLFLSFLSCTVALFLFVSSFEKLTLKSQHLLSGVCIFPASFLFASFFSLASAWGPLLVER